MKVEGWLFAAGFFFFSLAALVYWLLSEEVVGTVALAFTSGLAFLTGYYLLFTARRIDRRPEDTVDAEIADGAGELGFYSPHSWWPLPVAFFAACTFLGIIIGWWLVIIGVIGGGLAVIGLVFEYYRGDPAY
jgi:Cytochrome c oxidase subunit IV